MHQECFCVEKMVHLFEIAVILFGGDITLPVKAIQRCSLV